MYIHDFTFICRSIGVANFNVQHLKHLKEARPDQLPAGMYVYTQCIIMTRPCVQVSDLRYEGGVGVYTRLTTIIL